MSSLTVRMMDGLDRLLTPSLRGGSYFTNMLAFGVTEEEFGGAWSEARRASYTEATGLRADRLTESGRARASQLR